MKTESVSQSPFSSSSGSGGTGFDFFGTATADPSIPFMIVLAILVIAAMDLFKSFRRKKRWNKPRRPPRKLYPELKIVKPFRRSMAKPTDQMHAVSKVRFTTQALMNKSEFRCFSMLNTILNDMPEPFRLMSQVSMGEILKPDKASAGKTECSEAFASINAKRLDFGLFDKTGHIRLAIEVQGSGHYLSDTAFMRDAVKREALRRAGVPMLEVSPKWSQQQLAEQVKMLLYPAH